MERSDQTADILSAFDDAGIGYAVTDREGRLLSASPAFLAETQLPPDAVPSKAAWFTLDASEAVVQAVRGALWRDLVGGGQVWRGWVRWRLPDGETKFFEGTAKPLSDTRVVLIANDHSDLIEADRALEESEATLRTILDRLPLSVTLQGPDGRIAYINDYLPRRLGLPRTAFLNKGPGDVLVSKPGEAVADAIRRALDRREALDAWPLDITIGPLAGTSWLLFTRPILGHGGDLRRYLIIAVDRSAEAALAQERERFARTLAETQKVGALNDFAGALAHELSNILHPAGVYARALAKDPDQVDRGVLAGRIADAVRSAGDILRRTLLMARGEAEPRKVQDLRPFLHEVVETARDLAPRGLTYAVDPPEGAVSAVLVATEFRQVLLNLLNNAAEAQAHKGRILIRVEDEAPLPANLLVQPTASGPFALVAVIDEGEGMDVATATHTFEPFFTTKSAGRGTGLGLPVVLGLVTGWGGTVSVDSAPGEGSTFSIWVPKGSPKRWEERGEV